MNNGNAILSNSIYSNAKLGIDLGGTGTPSTNTPGGPHSGPNDLQNYPVLTGVTLPDPQQFVTISGTLDSTPAHTFLIQFFLNPANDPSGHRAGSTVGRFDTGHDESSDGSRDILRPRFR